MENPKIPTLIGQISVAESPNFLGNPAVVFRLIRDYVGGIVMRGEQALAGEMTGKAAAQIDVQQAKALIEILAGRNSDFVSLGRWNSAPIGEGGLRSWLHDNLREVAPLMVRKKPDGPIEALAAHLMSEAYELIREMMAGLPEEDARDRIMTIIYQGTRLALGMPEGDGLPEEPANQPA